MIARDTILIQGLELYAFHGASDEEQVVGHRYQVEVRLVLDVSRAMASDALSDTVNYAEVAQVLQQVATTYQYRLLEALAGRMVEQIFLDFALVEEVCLRVSKLLPPFPAIVGSVGVEITRQRKSR
jgi:dihydroneopterin aldolase